MSISSDEPTIEFGPRPGLLGDVASLHGRYYADAWGFPLAFECKVACEMACFLGRYDRSKDLVLSARDGHRTFASITLDGSDPELAQGLAHLRWFVVDPQSRGKGVGRRLIDEAVGFARRTGFERIFLTTFRGLDAAATLYRRAGFAVVQEAKGQTWGRPVMEQRLELDLRPAP